MSEEFKDQLKQVSANLTNINATLQTISKLIEAGKISVVDDTEGVENPASISLNGDIVGAVLRPVINTLSRRKESTLAIKEQILNALEDEMSGSQESTEKLDEDPRRELPVAVEVSENQENQENQENPEKPDKLRPTRK